MNIDTLVDDVYSFMLTKEVPEQVDPVDVVEQMASNMKQIMRTMLAEHEDTAQPRNRLRLSNIGKDDRYLWHVVNGTEKEHFRPETLIKFLYGNLVEEMVLALVKLSGHAVTHEQAPANVEGITGSMDCKIDGVVIDVKSASSFGMKKFKDGSLATDDPFGYVAQAKAYAYSEGETKFGWLAMDKVTGQLVTLVYESGATTGYQYDSVDMDIAARARHLQAMVKLPEVPQHCFQPVPEGKSGNMKLATGCSYCAYKDSCWPQARKFLYSKGPTYLVEVKNEPKVSEVVKDDAGQEKIIWKVSKRVGGDLGKANLEAGF